MYVAFLVSSAEPWAFYILEFELIFHKNLKNWKFSQRHWVKIIGLFFVIVFI